MDSRQVGAARPGAAPSLPFDVLRIHAEHPCDVTILSPAITGILTHYTRDAAYPDGHSWLCLNSEHCPGEADGLPQRWQGYLAVVCEGRRGILLACLGTLGAERLLCMVPAPRTLRGVRCILSRGGKGSKGPVSVQPSPRAPHKMPAHEVDIWPTLAQMYGGAVRMYAPQAAQEGR